MESLWSLLAQIALDEYGDIVERAILVRAPSGRIRKLRLALWDGSFIDVWISGQGNYSFHWERRHLNGSLYRHDNAPHARWRHIPTFPKHFHNGQEDQAESSFIPAVPEEALRYVLDWVRRKMRDMARGLRK